MQRLSIMLLTVLWLAAPAMAAGPAHPKGNPNGPGTARMIHMLTMANQSPKSVWPQHEKNMLSRLATRMRATNPHGGAAVPGALNDIEKLFAGVRALSPAQFASQKTALVARFRDDMAKGLGRPIRPGDLEGLDEKSTEP